MHSELPLRIRLDIRDKWDAKDGSMQLAIEDLAKSLGYTIKPEPEWPALWNDLNENFPDKSTFIPTLTRLVATWYQLFSSRVDKDEHSKWTEELIEQLSQAGHNHSNTLWIQPSVTSDNNNVISRWDKVSKNFYIEVPKNLDTHMSRVDFDFDRDFDQFFSKTPPPGDLMTSLTEGPHVPEDAGEWADVVIETRKSSETNGSASVRTIESKPMRMPSVDTTPRPQDLLRITSPHYLIFSFVGEFPAWIQCSHERTLTFIADYLRKHAKTNVNDSQRRPVYKIELSESNFSHGVRDFMTIDTYMNLSYRGVHLFNPTLILTLIEGVLGYQRVKNSGSYWVFRHETGFV